MEHEKMSYYLRWKMVILKGREISQLIHFVVIMQMTLLNSLLKKAIESHMQHPA